MKKATNYIQSITSGKRNACKWERLAVDRHLQLFQNDDYYFDEYAANRIIEFYSLLKHTSGSYKGKPFDLLPWQAFALAVTYGWKVKVTDKRLINTMVILIPKKNGKTEFAAGVGLYGAFFEGEGSAEVYSMANKYDQACICWNSAKVMAKYLMKDSSALADKLKIYDSITTRGIQDQEENFFKPLAADNKTLDGLRPYYAIFDEVHEYRDGSTIENLTSGMVTREEPLTIIISTAGFNINGYLANYTRVLKDILEGRKEDDGTFAMIFEPDEDEYSKWQDREIWEKANPSIGVTPTWEGMERAYTDAVNNGVTAENNFKTKNLNIWVRSHKTWIRTETWRKNKGKHWRLEDMKGRQAFGALDLSSSSDLTCWGLFFPPENDKGKFRFWVRSYCPAENIRTRSRRDGVPYEQWERDGWLTATPGPTVDYSQIKEDMLEAFGWLQLVSIGFDPFFAKNFADELEKLNLPVYEFRQTRANFNEPIKWIEENAKKVNLDHQGNPVLDWAAGNVVVTPNAGGQVMFDKKSSREKIDPMVVLAMCVGEYLDWKIKNKDIDPTLIVSAL